MCDVIYERTNFLRKVFDKTYVTSSVATEYELTCDSSHLRNIYGSTYMIGLLFGSFILGIVSDHFGRMKALMVRSNGRHDYRSRRNCDLPVR